MKKILCAVMALLLLFTGCSMNEVEIQELSEDIKANITIRHKSFDYEAVLEHNSSQTKIIYSAPTALSGLTLTRTENGCEADFLGLKFNSQENIFTENSTLVIIDKVLNVMFSDAQLNTKRQDDKIIISGKTDSDEFQAVRYKDKPELVSISIPSQELTVSFTSTEKNTDTEKK